MYRSGKEKEGERVKLIVLRKELGLHHELDPLPRLYSSLLLFILPCIVHTLHCARAWSEEMTVLDFQSSHEKNNLNTRTLTTFAFNTFAKNTQVLVSLLLLLL